MSTELGLNGQLLKERLACAETARRLSTHRDLHPICAAYAPLARGGTAIPPDFVLGWDEAIRAVVAAIEARGTPTPDSQEGLSL